MRKKKLKTKDIQMRYDLEVIRDEICGLYGQDCRIIYGLDDHEREIFKRYLDRVLESIDSFQSKYDFELESWMWKLLFKPEEI